MFHEWSLFILDIEKEYANDPLDSGGETWWGFTEQFLKDAELEPPKTSEDAIGLLYDYFWVGHKLYDMHWLAAWMYGDALFHHSPRSAAKCLQAGLGVKQDGYVGPITRAAATDIQDTIAFWERYSIRRNNLFHAIAEIRKKDVRFVKGWNNRLIQLSSAAYRANT